MPFEVEDPHGARQMGPDPVYPRDIAPNISPQCERAHLFQRKALKKMDSDAVSHINKLTPTPHMYGVSLKVVILVTEIAQMNVRMNQSYVLEQTVIYGCLGFLN